MDAARDKTSANQFGPAGSRRKPDAQPTAALTETDWIRLYTSRILRAWFHQEAPLGLAWTYANWIRKDLSECYGRPLMRAFIEETYRRPMNRET